MRGTLAVIALAKRKGFVPAARPLLDELVARGIHIEHALLQRALKLAGE